MGTVAIRRMRFERRFSGQQNRKQWVWERQPSEQGLRERLSSEQLVWERQRSEQGLWERLSNEQLLGERQSTE